MKSYGERLLKQDGVGPHLKMLGDWIKRAMVWAVKEHKEGVALFQRMLQMAVK